jgi:hypothetical protein
MHRLFSAVTICLLLAATSSTALGSVFLRAGIDGGGEDVGILSLDGTRLVRVSTGTGTSLEFGKRIQKLNQQGIDVITEIVVGYKLATSDSIAGKLEFSRYMLSFNRFWGVGVWRVGVGLSLHNNAQMQVSGTGFDNPEQPVWTINESVGFAAMIDYSITTNIQLGVKATSQNYHLSDALGNSGMADASNVGLFFNLLLE